jgi:hypothetical protein
MKKELTMHQDILLRGMQIVFECKKDLIMSAIHTDSSLANNSEPTL